MAYEGFLNLFEDAIQKQVDLVGKETAHEQAKKAGLGVSPDGHIVSCMGNPQLVLLRLIKFFTAGGNLQALVQCMPLINEMEKLAESPEDQKNAEKSDKVTESV